MEFPSSLVPLFQNEFKCETFHMQLHFHANQSHFHKNIYNSFALRLAFKQRLKGTRKRPIDTARTKVFCERGHLRSNLCRLPPLVVPFEP